VSRLFDGVDDQMVFDVPASSSGQGVNLRWGTLLIVVKIAQSSGSWMSFLEKEHNNGTSHGGFGRHSNNSPYMAYASSLAENGAGLDITSADGWMVVAVTKATGTATPNLIKAPIGGSVSSNAAGSTIGDLSDSSNGRVRIGGNDDWANMYVAAVAAFHGVVLTTTDVQGIADAATTQSIADLNPTWLIDDSDAFATDLMGSGHDRTSITGTTDSADDPSGWVYGLGGGGSSPQTVGVTGLGSAEAFGSVTAAPGGVTVAVPGLTSAADLGTVTAVPGGVSVAVTGLGSAEAFGTPTVAPGGTTIAVPGLDTAADFGAVSAGGGTNVAVPGLGTAADFGAVTVATGGTTIAVPGLDSAAAFGDITTSGGEAPTFHPAIHGGKF
jgi:hypothetical protein